MRNFTSQVKKIQHVQQAPWRAQTATFNEVFDDPMIMITAKYGERSVRCIVALCEEEVEPLTTQFWAPGGLYKSPIHISDVEVETRPIEISELCEEPDPRNGNAQEGLEAELLRDLLDRFSHLKGKDINGAESWVWHDVEPYPIIDGKLHFRPRKYKHTVRNEDLWFEMPMNIREQSYYHMGDLDFRPPGRLALTQPNGKMRAYYVHYGFIGPEDFVWLTVLPTKLHARATFEGIRETDLKYMPRDLKEAASRWKRGIKPYGTGAFDRGDEPPRITGTHAYGPGWKVNSLIRLTQEGYSLIPNTVRAKEDADHMVSLIARDGNTLNGPWHIAKDGALPTGPFLGKVGAPWWGFEVRVGRDDLEKPLEQWRAVMSATCDFAEPIFLKPPQLGPLSNTLIGPAKGNSLKDHKWGAICSQTGRELVPFEFAAYEDVSSSLSGGNDCMVFTDHRDRHHVFDLDGTLLLGPLRTFEVPDEFGPPLPTAYETRETEEERRWTYIKLDLPRWYKKAKARERFGDLDRHAPDLSDFAGRLTEGRKDAELAGLWHATVEITKEGEAHGVPLNVGATGRVNFGDAAPYGGSSMFDWLKELPVSGLVPGNPGRVVGVPFANLRVPPSQKPK